MYLVAKSPSSKNHLCNTSLKKTDSCFVFGFIFFCDGVVVHSFTLWKGFIAWILNVSDAGFQSPSDTSEFTVLSQVWFNTSVIDS